MDETAQESQNLFNFCETLDEQFLNPLTQSHGDLSAGPFYDQLAQFNAGGLQTNSPSTPSSFGFKKSPSRVATVRIYHQKYQQESLGVEIYLVSDILESTKAGLIFKTQEAEVDLRIDKTHGRQLEAAGRLDKVECELWADELSQWVHIKATI